MSTPADANSITLSRPNAISTRLPAVAPAAMATTASTVIHPIVSHSSRKALRMSGNRSDRGGKIRAGGGQDFDIRQAYGSKVLMSAAGQSRPKCDVRLTSALLLIATEQRTSHHVSVGEEAWVSKTERFRCF